ncbi:hypothetical protein M9458_028936, partial [Cirrhinus mrigala]
MTRTSVTPPYRSLLRRNAQQGRSTYLTPNVKPFWAQLTNLWALDIQAADGPSRSFKLGTGGPVCTVISPGTSKAAPSVPCLTLLANYLQENWFHYPHHRGPSPTSGWTLLLISQTLK